MGARGLTLAELILAMLLLGLLIVSVLSLFLALVSSSAKSNDQTIGVLYAERVLDAMAESGRKNYPAFTANPTGQRAVYDHDSDQLTTFVYSITATELTPATNPGVDLTPPTTMGQNWLLEVEVRWWATNQAQAKAGYGNLFVRQARVVYVPRS